MSAFILLSLPLSILLVLIVVAAAFMDVGLRPSKLATTVSQRKPMSIWPVIEVLQSTSQLTSKVPGAVAGAFCPETSLMPEVTDLEAHAIASELKQRGAAEVNRILKQSVAHHSTCPMRRQDGLCACSVVRPLSCLGRCILGADSPEWTNGLGLSISTAFNHHLQTHHTDATTRRLDDALVAILDERHAARISNEMESEI